MVSQSIREPESNQAANKAANRMASPSVVIGLGSTSCQIARRLDEVSSSWSFADRKSLGFLYICLLYTSDAADE